MISISKEHYTTIQPFVTLIKLDYLKRRKTQYHKRTNQNWIIFKLQVNFSIDERNYKTFLNSNLILSTLALHQWSLSGRVRAMQSLQSYFHFSRIDFLDIGSYPIWTLIFALANLSLILETINHGFNWIFYSKRIPIFRDELNQFIAPFKNILLSIMKKIIYRA